MDKRPLPDLNTLFPIGLGALSLFGICLVLLVGRLGASRAETLQVQTSTPFDYVLLGTEPGISTMEVETPEPGFPDSSGSSGSPNTSAPGFAITAQQGLQGGSGSSSNSSSSSSSTSSSSSAVQTAAQNTSGAPIIVLGTSAKTSTPGFIAPSRTPTITFTPRFTPSITPSRTPQSQAQTSVSGQPTNTPTRTPTRTATSASVAPLNPGTYDDTDSHLLYGGSWSSTNVSGAYQNTLHVSNTLNNSVTFSFIGDEVRLFYQSGPSLGTIRISIDGAQFDLNESDTSTQSSEWVSAALDNKTHTVVITHFDGSSVNLDEIIVPDASQ